jgi:hypothetical protein
MHRALDASRSQFIEQSIRSTRLCCRRTLANLAGTLEGVSQPDKRRLGEGAAGEDQTER